MARWVRFRDPLTAYSVGAAAVNASGHVRSCAAQHVAIWSTGCKTVWHTGCTRVAITVQGLGESPRESVQYST
jgi:hypothetical protein